MSDNLISEGRYPAVAVRVPDDEGNEDLVRWGTAGEKNTTQVLIYFELLEGEHAGEVYPWFGYFSKASYERTVESLRFCGFKGNDLNKLNEQELRQKVQVQIGHNTYTKRNDETGEEKEVTFARVDWVNRIGSGAIKLNNPMSKDEQRKFAAMMTKHIASIPEVDGETVSKSNGKGVGFKGSDPAKGSGGDVDQDPGPASEFDDIPF
jgi:hypothetical protein